MARFTKAINIWNLSDAERAKLQPGQWVFAGDEDVKGVFMGEGSSTVVAWLGNARSAAKYADYMQTLRDYGRTVAERRKRKEKASVFSSHFDSYVIEGDSIECEVDGIRYVARLERDTDSTVDDAECYTAKQIAAWRNDEWHFFGVVISAYVDDVCADDNAASLWGIEGNFPSRRKNPNTYFRDVANELLPEAIEAARESISRTIAKLQTVAA